MAKFNGKQRFLFSAEAIFDLRPLEKYEILFSFLDNSPLQRLYPSTGRAPIPYEALFRALIYKGFKTSSYLSDLVRELRDNPNLASMLGFHPLSVYPALRTFLPFYKILKTASSNR